MIYNAITNQTYAEPNARTLAAAITQHGWTSRAFAGFEQWKAAGRFVKKGETGTPVFFFVPVKSDPTGKTKVRKVKFVFNVEQTDLAAQLFAIPQADNIASSQTA